MAVVEGAQAVVVGVAFAAKAERASSRGQSFFIADAPATASAGKDFPCAPGMSARGQGSERSDSDVEIQRELDGRRAQADGVQLSLHLVLDPRLDHVGREHVALEQELVILLQ